MTQTSKQAPPPQPGQRVRTALSIDAVDDEGRGRAAVDDAAGGALAGWDVAVRGALPGDRIDAVVVERAFAARGLVQVRVERAPTALSGPLHIERDCPHVAPCPGCPLEGVDESFAHALKRGRIEQALRDAGLFDVEVDDVVAARAPRQKVKLTAGGVPGRLRFGLYIPHTHVLRGAEGCPYQHGAIADAVAAVQAVLDRWGASADDVKALVVRAFLEGPAAVLVVRRDLTDAVWAELAALDLPFLGVRVDDSDGNSLVGGALVRQAGKRLLTPLEPGGGPPTSVDAFCQTDPLLAAELYARAAEHLDVDTGQHGKRYADLYAGTGGFARALLARGAGRVVAVERGADNVEALAALDRVEVIAAPVEQALPQLAAMSFAGIVADPPKAGLGPCAAPLAALGAPRVVLVACDPDAGAADARAFVDAGYRLSAVVPFDLFPSSTEIETLFTLERAQ